jgi:hypothetical protein
MIEVAVPRHHTFDRLRIDITRGLIRPGVDFVCNHNSFPPLIALDLAAEMGIGQSHHEHTPHRRIRTIHRTLIASSDQANRMMGLQIVTP